jgi:hypothetical protein
VARTIAALALLAALTAFGISLFGHLAHPLLWQDEGETAMYGGRVLEHGYPKVHGERNVVYEFGTNLAQGVKERYDAYIGTTWGHFYFAAPAVWWARGADDLYDKTFRMRLPFAVAGALGVAWMLIAVLPAFRRDRRPVLAFSAGYFLMAALSVSLTLHLREMRYYPLFLLLSAAILQLHLARTRFGTVGPRSYAAGLLLLLVLLFNVFYSAWFVFGALLGLDRLLALRTARREGTPVRAVLEDFAPLALSLLCVAPLLVFYETFEIASVFSDAFDLGVERYLSNLEMAVGHFLRHEFLAAAIAARVAVGLVDARLRRRGVEPPPGPDRRAAVFLAAFATGYLLLGCVNPLLYERYFVILSPMLSLLFLLDAFALWASAPLLSSPDRAATARVVTALALAVLLVGTGLARSDEWRGRVAELREPYRGPLDFVIPYLASHYDDPSALVIATNYEAHPLMVYLGSHVIVGTSLNNIVAERSLSPDVVFPRRWWKRGLGELRGFLERGEFERHRFDLPDLPYNNNPALSRSPWIPDPHRFRTATLETPKNALTIHQRVVRGPER